MKWKWLIKRKAKSRSQLILIVVDNSWSSSSLLKCEIISHRNLIMKFFSYCECWNFQFFFIFRSSLWLHGEEWMTTIKYETIVERWNSWGIYDLRKNYSRLCNNNRLHFQFRRLPARWKQLKVNRKPVRAASSPQLQWIMSLSIRQSSLTWIIKFLPYLDNSEELWDTHMRSTSIVASCFEFLSLLQNIKTRNCTYSQRHSMVDIDGWFCSFVAEFIKLRFWLSCCSNDDDKSATTAQWQSL